MKFFVTINFITSQLNLIW